MRYDLDNMRNLLSQCSEWTVFAEAEAEAETGDGEG